MLIVSPEAIQVCLYGLPDVGQGLVQGVALGVASLQDRTDCAHVGLDPFVGRAKTEKPSCHHCSDKRAPGTPLVVFSSSGWTRTNSQPVNSRSLYH